MFQRFATLLKKAFSLSLTLFLSLPASTFAEGTPLSLMEVVAEKIRGSYIRHKEPDFLTFDELQSLSQNPNPVGSLKQKLDKFWMTPIINNEAYYRSARPHNFKDPQLGNFLRIASWNIEKSFHIDEAIQLFTSPDAYEKMVNLEKAPVGTETWIDMKRQRERLLKADIILFQEMEIGIKRSGYINAAAEMAKALNMNYAFAPQYLEVDPVTMGTEQLEFEEDDIVIQKEAREFFTVEPAKYKGVFGSAVLSRYPIKYVEVRPLKTQPYDWYWGELQKIGVTEKMRRAGTKSLFKNVIQRELKAGGRHYFRVDLEVPELPKKTLTLINIHLEIKCEPIGRQAQMTEILGYVQDIENPVILMGDFNMAPTDISSTTAGRILKRTASNPTTWFSLAVNVLSPHALVLNTTRLISNVTKNFNDPTAKHVPVVAPNPMKPFMEMMENYRFTDGRAFDFRGDPARSVGNKKKTLANSNQRGEKKGFVTSFRVLRPIGIVGKFRLDWVFVKSFLIDPYDVSGPYRFAPHFGETLEAMNYNLTLPISDHAPNVVDLPFNEPNI